MLEKIDFLLRYINGNVNSQEDNIISESSLYDLICKIIDRLTVPDDESASANEILRKCIEECTAGYVERLPGSRERLTRALEVIVTAYYATLVSAYSNKLFDAL